MGWSVEQVVLDFLGSILSLFQLLLEAVVLQDASLVTGDPIKFLLGAVSLCYDLVLMLQHFHLYSEARSSNCAPDGCAAAKDTDDEESEPFSSAP